MDFTLNTGHIILGTAVFIITLLINEGIKSAREKDQALVKMAERAAAVLGDHGEKIVVLRTDTDGLLETTKDHSKTLIHHGEALAVLKEKKA